MAIQALGVATRIGSRIHTSGADPLAVETHEHTSTARNHQRKPQVVVGSYQAAKAGSSSRQSVPTSTERSEVTQ